LRQFVLAFAFIFVALCAVRAATIYYFDPRVRFYSDDTKIPIVREQAGKPRMIRTYPHNAVIIGTSKLAAVDPADIDTPDLKFFNASWAAALPEDTASFLDLFVHDAKLVVISLDIMMMNEKAWHFYGPTSFGEPSFKDDVIAKFWYLTDTNEFFTSAGYLINGKPYYGILKPNGGRDSTQDLARSAKMTAPDFAGPLRILQASAFDGFTYSHARVPYIEKMKALMDERHIPYVVLISPENRQMMEMIKASGNYWALRRFRQDVRQIFPEMIDYSESWVSDDANFFKFDPLHYRPDVGAKMIREAIGKQAMRPADAGQSAAGKAL
jgi:hypothetical protein